MSKFKIILLSVFGVFIIAAVFVFSFFRGGAGTSQVPITVWGTIPSSSFSQFLNDSGLSSSKTALITYAEKNPATLDASFTEALAVGDGPDIIILPQDMLWQERGKLTPIPYASITQATFEKTFIDEGNLFLGPSGVYGLPLYVDPLVMYWNKDILASAGVAEPIGYWDEIYAAALKLTEKDAAGNITRSTIALGETANIPHAKDILSLLMLEAGTPITDVVNGTLASELSNGENLPTPPADSALDFYTQFSNPEKAFYTWNRSLLPAETSFIAGDSAFYLGYASELPILRAKSPTLNLGVVSVPQSRVGNRLTFGRLYVAAVSKGTRNPSAAMSVAVSLVSSANDAALSKELGLPPARRDLLAAPQNDPAMAAFYAAALQSHGWLDPNAAKTATLFDSLIGDVTSGRADTATAVQTANDALSSIISGQ